MKGHLRERSPGHWAIILDVPRDDGRRHRKWHSFKGTKRQAENECSRLISEIAGGVYSEPTKTTLETFMEKWLEHIKTQVTPKTFERYAEITRATSAPYSGRSSSQSSNPNKFRALTRKP